MLRDWMSGKRDRGPGGLRRLWPEHQKEGVAESGDGETSEEQAGSWDAVRTLV